MGLQTAPGFIGAAGYAHPVELMRNLTEALTDSGTGLLKDTAGFAMTPSGSAMQLTIAPGFAVLLGLESNSQGSYFVWSDASEVLAWPAHGGTNRMDTLLLRVIDTQYGSDADTPQAEWEIVQGTSATALPDSSFLAGGDHYRPGAWWRVADVLVQTTDLVMSATDITDYRKLASVNLQRLNTGGMFLQRVKYTASGTFTKANYPNAKKFRVVCVGGGGAGGGAAAATGGTSVSAGGGGQAGGYSESWLDAASVSSSVTITVGAGGTGVSGADGNDGTASSFGSAVIASGGQGGRAGTAGGTVFPNSGGGDNAATIAGDIASRGAPGHWGLRLGATAGQAAGGPGASTVYGGGGNSGTNTQGGVGQGPGAGGGGSTNSANSGSLTARVGGAGAAGIVFVDVYI